MAGACAVWIGTLSVWFAIRDRMPTASVEAVPTVARRPSHSVR